MKRLMIISTMLALVIGSQALVNCSSPLQSERITGPVNTPSDTNQIVETLMIVDTVLLIDTLILFDSSQQIDTVIILDTLIEYDTVNQIDTVAITDTIIVTIPDTTGATTLCDRINGGQKDLLWLLRNPAGSYRLEFVVSVAQNKPPKELEIAINGETYRWFPNSASEFTIELDLPANSEMRVTPMTPVSYGHDLDICLTITPL